MEKNFILKGIRRWFDDAPELCGKVMSVYKKAICHIGAPDSPDILVHPYLCQLWEGRNVTSIEEDLICGLIWQKIIANKIKYIVQETPHCHADHCIKENDELLKSYTDRVMGSKVVDAEFRGGKKGADGHITFSEPPIERAVKFPVEIGYVNPTQVYYHLFMGERCLARLPYNSDYIIYFDNLEPWIV